MPAEVWLRSKGSSPGHGYMVAKATCCFVLIRLVKGYEGCCQMTLKYKISANDLELGMRYF